MIPNKSYYSNQNFNNMILKAKREAMKMSEKSTNSPEDFKQEELKQENQNIKKPSNPSVFGDLLGNFNLNFKFDEDTILLCALLYILYRNNADKSLLIALAYVLLF